MAKISTNDIIACPYCGRKGRVATVFADKQLFVIHRCEWTEVISQATGKLIECEVFHEGCKRGIKITDGT